MFKQKLQSEQPIVYQTLYNALKKDSVSHCYIFAGPQGTSRFETAILLAQSLVCEDSDDVFACEECVTCARIHNNNYADLIIIDGKDSQIKIDKIELLQKQFSQTALEKAGRKIFIINNCENITLKAANSLLKFIEEPFNNITGIFITTRLDSVLPTIVSRCQPLNFKPVSTAGFYQKAKEQDIDELTAHLLSRLVQSASEITETADNDSFITGKMYFLEFMHEYLDDPRSAVLYIQDNAFKVKGSDRKKDKECFRFFLDIAMVFANDYFGKTETKDEEWNKLLQKAHEKKMDGPLYLEAVSAARTALKKSANMLLLADQLMYKLIGGIK